MNRDPTKLSSMERVRNITLLKRLVLYMCSSYLFVKLVKMINLYILK